jgi:hypothetical protein
VFVGQMQHHESLSRDEEHRYPHAVVEHPACRGVLDALAFLVRQGGLVGLERVATAVLYGRRDEPTSRHHPQAGPDTLGLLARERGGQKLRGFEEAQPAFAPGLACVAVEPRFGGSRLLIQCVRRQAQTALLVDACLTVREPRRQGPCHRVDDLVGLGPRAWASSLPIGGWRADGPVVEKRGLPACAKTGERLLGIRFTGPGGPAQPLEGPDCLLTLLAPLPLAGALGLGLAMVRVEAHPALRSPAITRGHDRRALTIGQRGHGRRLRRGEDLLRRGQGRGDPREPREAGIGQLVPMLGVRESPVSAQRGWAVGGLDRCHVVPADLPAHCAITTLATPGLQPQRETGLRLHDPCQPPLVEVRAMSPPLAVGHVDDLFVGGRLAVRAAIDMATCRIERGERGCQPQTRGRRSGNEAVEGCQSRRVQRIQGAPEGVLIEMTGWHAGRNEASEGFILDKMGHERELLGETAQTIEPHGLDRMAGSHKPRFRVLLRRLIKDCSDAEFFKHPRDQTHMIEDLGTGRVWL